ncbi:MAG: ATP-grasp domain-containing protein [Candidatus Hodarchaeota archaeon]
MAVKVNSILVVGFNTRPLAKSLKNANYQVYSVDFFGDLDLYPNVKDFLIITKELESNYKFLKDNYSEFLVQFTIEMLRKHNDINYLLIGSGLDDAYEGRDRILREIKEKELSVKHVNNHLEVIKKSRDIEKIYDYLKSKGFNIPLSLSYEQYKNNSSFEFPFILKKKRSAGGINVFKIENNKELNSLLKKLKIKGFNPSDWLIQEFIEGIPVSCTVISNGTECEIISINRQIIGEKFLNPPGDFVYCGNVVPANLLKEDYKLISEISLNLTKLLGLKGINGFDFVLKSHYPYLMEINPRIPGSIRASEEILDLNLLNLHIQSFDPKKWRYVKNKIRSAQTRGFATKLIFFAPKEIDKELLNKINNIEFVHDKSEPINNILKEEPVCTVLFKGKDFSESYFGAIKIIDKIKNIIY